MIIIDSDQLPLKDWFEIHDRRVEIAAEKYLWWVSQSSKQEELCVFKTARKKKQFNHQPSNGRFIYEKNKK